MFFRFFDPCRNAKRPRTKAMMSAQPRPTPRPIVRPLWAEEPEDTGVFSSAVVVLVEGPAEVVDGSPVGELVEIAVDCC